jgi:tetratricopeptide (TPR) repeat protein
VRRLGDSLDLVEAYIRDRSQSDAGAALRELFYRVPRESLDNSARAALAALGRLKDYPEAEYWIGEVFRSEGEGGLALEQYQKALAQKSNLEAGDFELEILYKMAELYRLRENYNEMEETVNRILSSRDALWAGETGIFTRRSMGEILGREDGAARFLTLYRYNNVQVERAHRMLGFFYYDSGRHSPGPALDHLMFAFLIQNTVILEELRRRQFDYAYTSLDDLAARALKLPLLREYIEESDYFKTVYYMASSLFGEGKTVPARQFWSFLAAQEKAGQWQARALKQLAHPEIEKPLQTR